MVWLATGTAAYAQDSGLDHPIDSTLEFLDLKAKPSGSSPDFVEASRPKPGATEFMAVGTQHATRPLKVKTPAEIKAAEAELDAARDAQIAGKRPVPSSQGAVKRMKPSKPLDLKPPAASR